MDSADWIFRNGKVTTLDPTQREATAIAVRGDKIERVGSEKDVMSLKGIHTKEIDLCGRRVIPGLIDSHIHFIRGGLNYNLELRWDGVPSLALAMEMLKQQAQITPPPQWVRVVGGFSAQQFHEKRLPSLDEINAAAPDTPVFILHLYDRALLNRAALRVCGFTKETPNPPGGVIERDSQGNPTGLLLAKPNAMILYSTLARGPTLPFEYQINSTLHFMRELNRLGITGVVDAGGGFQKYPEDYAVIQELAKEEKLTLRIAYNLFTQKPKEELYDFVRWSTMVEPGQGNSYFRHNGAGEMLVFSAADFEDFREPRPNTPPNMEMELERVVEFLVENRWPFRLHATYNETIEHALSVFERVNREIPFQGLHWFFDHAETITKKNIERVRALGGGIAVQNRMAFQGEYFAERYGLEAARRAPPLHDMLNAGIPVGGGTDATRVASYNPWMSLYWLVTGKTVAGLRLSAEENCLEREQALQLWTKSNTWFSNDEGVRGQLTAGQLADFVVLSDDFFTTDAEHIKDIVSCLTVVGGKVVHGDNEFDSLSPALPPVLPDWSPVKAFGGYQRAARWAGEISQYSTHFHTNRAHTPHCCENSLFEWNFGCMCWAF